MLYRIVSFSCLLFCFSFTGVKPNMRQLNKLEINELVNAHNVYRKQVNVPDINYSERLSVIAKEVALMNCRRKNLIHTNSPYGENLFYNSVKSTPTEVIDYFATEEQYFSHRKRTFNSRSGHYSQIIWKNTTEFGVAIAVDKDGGEYWAIVYDPPGNQLGEKAY